jgi:hypothetical protein
MTKRLRVPQREVQAEVELYGRDRRSGHLYVPAIAPGGGAGRLCDRLNDPSEQFLALTDDGPGCLISKDRIVKVVLDADQREVELETEVEMREVKVRVDLAGTDAVEGTLPYNMPPDRGRLIDYLNAAPRFIPLIGSNRFALLNRDYLTVVTNLEEYSPGPD